MRCDVLLLAAFHPELAALRGPLGAALCGHVGQALVVGRAVGVGLCASAVGAAIAVSELRPRIAIAIGTCGAYGASGLRPGDVVVGRSVRLVDAAIAQGIAEFPEPMTIALDADSGMAQALHEATRGRLVDVANTLAITVDDKTSANIALASGAQVEHLEAHGVAAACAAIGTPFGVVLGVANVVGSRAREQWRAHHRAASQAAADAVLAWLRSGWSP